MLRPRDYHGELQPYKDVVIKNCIITNFRSGIGLNHASNFIIEKNSVVNSTARGVWIEHSLLDSVLRNEIERFSGRGMDLYSTTYSLIEDNTIQDSRRRVENILVTCLDIASSINNEVTGNKICLADQAVSCRSSEDNFGANNNFEGDVITIQQAFQEECLTDGEAWPQEGVHYQLCD